MNNRRPFILGVTMLAVAIAYFGLSRTSASIEPARADSIASVRTNGKYEQATFSMGCFWHSEEMFSEIKGVIDAVPGYCGGTEPNPTYELVGSGATKYAESVNVTYDPSVVSYAKLLQVFFTEHDPTTPNYSAPDAGPEYRSMIFYRNDAQKDAATSYIATLQRIGSFHAPIVTEVQPFARFWPAEEYHRHYFRKHPEQGYINSVTVPEIEKFRRDFPDLVKQ